MYESYDSGPSLATLCTRVANHARTTSLTVCYRRVISAYTCEVRVCVRTRASQDHRQRPRSAHESGSTRGLATLTERCLIDIALPKDRFFSRVRVSSRMFHVRKRTNKRNERDALCHAVHDNIYTCTLALCASARVSRVHVFTCTYVMHVDHLVIIRVIGG